MNKLPLPMNIPYINMPWSELALCSDIGGIFGMVRPPGIRFTGIILTKDSLISGMTILFYSIAMLKSILIHNPM